MSSTKKTAGEVGDQPVEEVDQPAQGSARREGASSGMLLPTARTTLSGVGGILGPQGGATDPATQHSPGDARRVLPEPVGYADEEDRGMGGDDEGGMRRRSFTLPAPRNLASMPAPEAHPADAGGAAPARLLLPDPPLLGAPGAGDGAGAEAEIDEPRTLEHFEVAEDDLDRGPRTVDLVAEFLQAQSGAGDSGEESAEELSEESLEELDVGPPTNRIETVEVEALDAADVELLGLADEAAQELDAGPPTHRIPAIAPDFQEGLAEPGAEGADGPPTHRIEEVSVEEVALPGADAHAEAHADADAHLDEVVAAAEVAEAGVPTLDELQEDFNAEATMIVESPLATAQQDLAGPPTEEVDLAALEVDDEVQQAGVAPGEVVADAVDLADAVELADAVDEAGFGGEATTVFDPQVETWAGVQPRKVTVRGMPSQVMSTYSNPPTPEQKPRVHAPGASAALQERAPHAQPVRRDPAPLRPADPRPAPDAGSEHAPGADDFEAQKTEIFDSPFQNEVLAARLMVLSGPGAGKEFLLNRPRNIVGRGQNNTVLIPDLAMSRQHLEIIQEADQSYLLKDLQSANGTRLNHTGIVEAELRHGDRIEAGKSEFQFILPGNQVMPRSNQRYIVLKKARASQSAAGALGYVPAARAPASLLDRVLTWVISVASVLIVALLAIMAYLYLNPPANPQAEAVAPQAAAQNARAQALYLQGVEKVKDHDWAAAHALFEQVAGIDAEFAGVGDQLARVERERQIAGIIGEARAALGGGALLKAEELLAPITRQSVYFEEAQRIRQDAQQRQIADLFQKAQQAVTEERFEEAAGYIDAILQKIPNHQGALDLRAVLAGDAQKLAELQQEEARREAQKLERVRSGASAPKKSPLEIAWDAERKPPAAAPAQPDLFASNANPQIQINFTRGFSLYKAGNFAQAATYFREAAGDDRGALASRATETAARIEAFEDTYNRAKRALTAKAWSAAINMLRQAQKADQQVAATGYFKAELNNDLAAAHGQLGHDAFARADYATAYQHYHQGQQFQSTHAALTSLGSELSKKARALYIQAASKRKSDPEEARALCRQITTMLAPGHELHQKAREMLNEL